ncbi:MAG: DUF3516 domain-containing protein [Eggerthellaceae bacterium]
MRNALFQRVRLASRDVWPAGQARCGMGLRRAALAARPRRVLQAHGQIAISATRSAAFLSIDEADEQAEHVWHVRQIFSDPEGDHDFAIQADVDLDATQEEGEAVFKNFRVGFFEELGE